jgi:glutamate/tyrosine decarboxylase-like PLP-dependent enzyme
MHKIDVKELVARHGHRVSPRLASWAFRGLRRIPAVRKVLDREYETMGRELEKRLRPYREELPTHARLPPTGLDRQEVLEGIRALSAREEGAWRGGFVSGGVYHGGDDHVAFVNQVYSLTSQCNPLHADVWPSTVKYEAEIVSMAAHMLGASAPGNPRQGEEAICGTVTSGGTESIMVAMRAYRDHAREQRGVTRPEVVAPVSAHPAFDKAAHSYGMTLKRVPVGTDHRADVTAMRRAITRRTVALVGSAPGFPHGLVDPVGPLSELARSRGLGFHTDACLGGFLLPWAERLGHPVPPFDFRLPGVTTMSADTHKFGYAPKGTSVVLYRGHALRRHQYFRATDWPGGLYCSPTVAGSRPGGLSAACWATMVSLGEDGYLEAARRILATAAEIKDGIARVPGLHVLGDPLWVIAFGSSRVDVYRVLDEMGHRGWSLNGLQRPPAVHLCVTLRHTLPGVAQRFLADLAESVCQAEKEPGKEGGMAPVYGLAGGLPARGIVADILDRYMDILYRV